MWSWKLLKLQNTSLAAGSCSDHLPASEQQQQTNNYGFYRDYQPYEQDNESESGIQSGVQGSCDSWERWSLQNFSGP